MKAKEGFTLVELIIVIFIISLTTALVMPRLWDTGERALKSEAKKISSTLMYIYDEAAGKKRPYAVKIDFNADSFSYASEKESRSFKMKDNIKFKDVIIPSLGEVSIGEVIYQFGPMGPEEPITLHLMKDDNEYTVMFNHINGRAKIREGHFVETKS
ncbi:MAG: prepilin-type N-terminal cleavage/methylation domain-containing protein [Nitrospirae bacterium]|nr:prepilin-type N-terminal cleavage/methylation domain-containing protein [Nitrospirota bacterium]